MLSSMIVTGMLRKLEGSFCYSESREFRSKIPNSEPKLYFFSPSAHQTSHYLPYLPNDLRWTAAHRVTAKIRELQKHLKPLFCRILSCKRQLASKSPTKVRSRPSTDSGSGSWIHHLLTETKYGPAKSRMTPVDVQIPMWPIMGKSHLPRQQANRQAEIFAPRSHRVRATCCQETAGAAVQPTA